MQTVPPAAAWGTSSRLASVPTEKKQRSRSPALRFSGVASSTSSSRSPYGTCLPAERDEAKARTFSNPRSARRPSVTEPTAPVAPTTPTLVMSPLCIDRGQLEGLVQGDDGALDIFLGYVEGDLDRRGGHEVRLHSEVAQRLERARGDSRMALH